MTSTKAVFFGGVKCSACAVLLLLFLFPTFAAAQVYNDGGTHSLNGSSGDVTVGIELYENPVITTLENNGLISGDVKIHEDGVFNNQSGGTINGDAVIRGGILNNSGIIYGTTTVESQWYYGTPSYPGEAVGAGTGRPGTLNNNYGGSLDTVNVSMGILTNSGNINSATINYEGAITNNNYISSVTVNYEGTLHNTSGGENHLYYHGYIDSATINGGTIDNSGGGIGDAIVNGGALDNSDGHIRTVTASDWGTLNNSSAHEGPEGYRGEGNIDSVTINDGHLNNGGYIGTATVNNNGISNYDVGTFDNSGRIDAVVLNAGKLNNSGSIGTATVNQSEMQGSYVENSGSIGDLTLNGGSLSNNFNGGSIDYATVSQRGEINNSGHIGFATVNESAVLWNWNSGDVVGVGGANVNGGTLHNYGEIVFLNTWNDGIVNNSGNIEYAFADNGVINNASGGNIQNAEVFNGGTIINNGWIENAAAYGSGTIIQGGGHFASLNVTQNLNVANMMMFAVDAFSGNDAILDTLLFTGTIGNLTFGEGATLLLHVGTTLNITGSLDLTGANILVDFGDYFDTNSEFDMSTLFAFSEEGQFSDADWFTTWEDQFQFAGIDENKVFSFADGKLIVLESPPSETPEPATLLLLGLGMSALPLARKIRRS